MNITDTQSQQDAVSGLTVDSERPNQIHPKATAIFRKEKFDREAIQDYCTAGDPFLSRASRALVPTTIIH